MPEFQPLIQASSPGQTVSFLIPRSCSFAYIRLALEYLNTFRFCQRNGFLLALHERYKERGTFDLHIFGLSFQREVYDFFSPWGWDKGSVKEEETQKCPHAINEEEKGGPCWTCVCVAVPQTQ